MRKIITSNSQVEFHEISNDGVILNIKAFQYGVLHYQIKNGKVVFYSNADENPWRNEVWSVDMPVTIDDEVYSTADEVAEALSAVMNDSYQEQLDELQEGLATEEGRAQAAEEALQTAIENETSRATSAETNLQGEITELSGTVATFDGRIQSCENQVSALTDTVNAEVTRATAKDAEHDALISGLTTSLQNEITRAQGAESALTNSLNNEIGRATSAETVLHNEILTERDRALAAESGLTNALNAEVSRSTAKDSEHDTAISSLNTSIQNEIERATSAETVLHDEILSERDRALAAESGITANLNAEISRATARENAIDNKVDAEVSRSTAKDASQDALISGLTTSLQNEINRAQGAENSLRSDLNAEISARTTADAAQLQRITALEVGKANASDVYTKAESDAKYTTKDYISGLTEAFFDAAAYDSQTKKINFYHGNTIKAQIDATSFIKDGMVDNVAISGSNLVITFNTDAGKEPISIPLSSIFDPSNYYTKSEIDSALSGKVDNSTFNTLSGRVDTISGDVITVSGRVDTISGTVETVKQEIITISGESVTSGEVQTMINESISGKADSDDVYTKNEVYTKAEVDEAIADIDLSDYYTKSEVDASQLAQDNKINAISGDIQTLNEKVDTISGESVTSGEVQAQIDNSISGKADKTDIYTYLGSDRIKVSTAAGVRRKTIDLNLPIYSGSGMSSLSLNSIIGTAQGGNQIKGYFSTGIGFGLTTNNASEVATGQYNISNTVGGVSWGNSGNTLFSVGNGEHQGDEHNAFEVRQNGDIYITSGGTTSSSMIKLQDHLGGGGGGGVTPSEVQTMIDESISGKTNQSDFTAHTANTTVHVTASEKSTWNAKSDFSGDYNDLTNKPTIPNYTAGSGITISNNVISAKIWSGTKAQYDALTTKSSDTIYLIYNS